MTTGNLPLLVHLQCAQSSFTSPHSRPPHRLSTSISPSPLLFQHLSVSVDPSQTVEVLHSLIECTYDELTQQTEEEEDEVGRGEAGSISPHRPHHVRVKVIYRERVYAVSRRSVIRDALSHSESVIAEVRVKEGPLPPPPPQIEGNPTLSQPTVGTSRPSEPPPVSEEAKENPERNGILPSVTFIDERKSATIPASSSPMTAVTASSPGSHNGRRAEDVKENQEQATTATNVTEAITASTTSAPSASTSRSSPPSLPLPSVPSNAPTLLPAPLPPPPPHLPVHSSIDSVECVLCCRGGGVLKRTVEGQWCHLVCANWTEGTHFDWTTHLITGASRALTKAKRRLCRFCKRPKKTSAPIQCGEDGCPANFHLTCGQEHQLQTAHVDFLDTHRSELVAYCENHAKDELKEWCDDGCCVCVFMRPDEREPSRKLTCVTCGVSVHKTCYYGRDEELISDEEKEGDTALGEGFDWERWKCMRCEFIEDGAYRFPRQALLQKKQRGKKKGPQQLKVKRETVKVEEKEGQNGQDPHERGLRSTSPPNLRKDWRQKRKAPALRATEEKEGQGGAASAVTEPALPPAQVRGSSVDLDTSPTSQKRKRRRGRSKATNPSSPAPAAPARAPIQPPSSSPAPSSTHSAPSPTSARYLSDGRTGEPSTTPPAELRSPQTVLKALKSHSHAPSPSAAARAEYLTRVSGMDVGLMRAVLGRHGESWGGAREELIARLQAKMVDLPAESAEAERWRRDWEEATRPPVPHNVRQEEKEGLREAESKQPPPPNALHRALLRFAAPRVLQKLGKRTLQEEEVDVEEEEEEDKKGEGELGGDQIVERLQKQAMEEIESVSEEEVEIEDGDSIVEEEAVEIPKAGRGGRGKGRNATTANGNREKKERRQAQVNGRGARGRGRGRGGGGAKRGRVAGF